MSLPSRLLGANPSIQVSTLLSGSLSTPSAKQAFDAGGYESISTYTLSTTTASVTFSSIPQTYKDLQLRMFVRESGANTGINSALFLRFNGDTNVSYARFGLNGNGSTVALVDAVTDNKIVLGDGLVQGGSTTGIFGAYIVDIYDYTSSTYKKTTRSIAGAHNTTGQITSMYTNTWNIVDAITSIIVLPETNSLATGSVIALYGIQGS